MYWPIGTPKAFATCNNIAPASIYVSHDGTPNPSSPNLASPNLLAPPNERLQGPHADEGDDLAPKTPLTPITPAVRSIEHEDFGGAAEAPYSGHADVPRAIATKEPILALRVSRSGHIFAVITSTTMTLWQTKVRDERGLS